MINYHYACMSLCMYVTACVCHCVFVRQETDDRTRRRQAENTRKLANRRDDIQFWKQELVNEIRAMENETENLQVNLSELERMGQ